MIDVTPNVPEVVAEVRDLDATFWDSPHTIRYAMNENGYGFSEIHAYRVARDLGRLREAHQMCHIGSHEDHLDQRAA